MADTMSRPMLPTGIGAGTVAIGMGGCLISDGDLAGSTDRARQVVAAVAAARAGEGR